MRILLLSFLFIQLLHPETEYISEAPSGLMVEFIREPLLVSISDPRPEFSWIVPGEAVMQSAFQILVASSESLIEKDGADLWNSNIITTKRSTEIEYEGRSLGENKLYYWKVRVWDTAGRQSPWSEIQSFKTGTFSGNATTGNRFIQTTTNPLRLIKTGEGSYFADFGKDAFGTLEFTIDTPRDDKLFVHLGEKIAGPCFIDRNPGGTIRYSGNKVFVTPARKDYKVNLSPDSRNTGPSAVKLPDSIGVIMPFRYCEIENISGELKPEDLRRKATWYFFDDSASSFVSSDTILNNIWDLCKYSIKATSFAGIYVDGDRERIPYEADAYINQLGHYYTDREYSIARRTNEYFMSHPTWPTEWILQTILLFYNDFMFTGNIESLATHYDRLVHKTLITLAREDGLISSSAATAETMTLLGFSDTNIRIRDIVDWPPSQKDTGWKLAMAEGERDGYEMVEINTVVNTFHYQSLVLMSRMAAYLGKSVDALLFQNRAEKVKKSINEKLFDKVKGIYTDGEHSAHSSLHANMMALAFGLVSDENIKSVTDFIKTRGMACSVYGSQFLLEGLYKAGEHEYAYSLLTATHDRSWWNMIRSGSTITLEAWDMKYKPNSDWNHAWGAAPANIIPGFMWGITPVLPGYEKAQIRPQLGMLRNCTIEVPTIKGPIKAAYRSTIDSVEYMISLPANMECDFIVPPQQVTGIILNGKKVSPVMGKINLVPGINKIEII